MSHLVVAAVAALGLATAPAIQAQVVKTNVILGSSVALGWKATGYYSNHYTNGSAVNSYGALLTQSLGTNGWWVVNKSVAGDATANVIGRFSRDVPAGADEILIALSLGNEGLTGSPHPQAICDQFFSGITNLINMSRQNGSIPLLGCIYPRDDFSASEYVYLKNMILRLNMLGVPNANFLGATDDGHGHWVHNLGDGDGLHPNDAGHYEIFLAIVPSVFDALKAGKPTPQWGNRDRFVRVLYDPNQPAPLSFIPDSTVHSFSMSFRVRTEATGTVASVTLPNSAIHPTIEITLTDLVYVATNGQIVSSGVVATNGAWHDVVVACQYAGRKTLFYVDGVLAGTVCEQLTPIGFVLGGHGSAAARPDSPAQADYQDWFVHRSMMNAEEVTAQHQGVLQQESLELYAPLDDPPFPQGCTVTNRAQSLSAATINGATLSAQPANFTSAPTTGAAPLTVTFTGPLTGSITNWFWDFGDGGTTNTSTASVVHTYTAGSYSVTLVTTDPEAVNTNSQSNYITALTAFQSWQIQYFNSTNGLAAPDADPDADGMNNLSEFLTGTDPTNSVSAFRIITVILQDSDILVIWEGCGGKTNAVQATLNLVESYADVSSNIILSGSGKLTTNFLDLGAGTNASRLYRVRLVP